MLGWVRELFLLIEEGYSKARQGTPTNSINSSLELEGVPARGCRWLQPEGYILKKNKKKKHKER